MAKDGFESGRIGVEQDDWFVETAPSVGGAVSALRWRGRDIFRPMPSGSTDVLQAGCFPMIPFANRIAGGRFTFEGRPVVLPILPRFAPNVLHGDGWRAAWTQVVGDAAMTLEYDHAPDAWPWRYRARQTVCFVEDRVRFTLSMVNADRTPMPAGLGLHPYFPVNDETRLTLAADAVWALSQDASSPRLSPMSDAFDWSDGPRVTEGQMLGREGVDHAYSGWGGRALLSGSGLAVTVTASANAAWAHVYAPRGQNSVCIEPVTHRPDAVNAPAGENSGLVVLAPGQGLSMWMEISVQV